MLGPSDVMTAVRKDFDLAAHADYQPTVRLVVAERDDLHGMTCEQVLTGLEEEGLYDDKSFTPFLVADERTIIEYQENHRAVVTFVDRWAQADHFRPKDLKPGVDGGVTQGRLPFAIKVLMYAYYAPICYLNLQVGNTDLKEQFRYPYDPNERAEPDDGGMDWSKEAPYDAYVVADAEDYEVSDANQGPRRMILGGQGSAQEQHRRYRLKANAAKALGLLPAWAPGHEYQPYPPDKDGGYGAEHARSMDKKTAKMFQQPWDLRPPTVN